MSELLDVKKDFPVLVNNKDLVYLDTGATALKPQSVIDKINEYLYVIWCECEPWCIYFKLSSNNLNMNQNNEPITGKILS